MAFTNGFDLSALSAYTQQNTELLSEAILSTEELAHVAVRTGVSVGTTSINIFSASLTEQDRNCAVSTADQGLVFDQTPITVADKALAADMCVTELRSFWQSEQMAPGAAGAEVLPFETVVATYVQGLVKQNISKFIGEEIKAQFAAGNPQLQGGTPAALDVNNALEQLNDLYDALDERVKMMDDVVIMLSPAEYRTAVRAIVAQGGAGFFHYNVGDGAGEILLPGTTAKLVKAQGFIGSSTRVAFPSKYVIFATGLLSDEENIRMAHDMISDKVLLRAYYRRGLAVYSIDQCATNGL
jgi:hypothetical protein